MADNTTIYVKQTERGLIEREAFSPVDHVNFKAHGWFLKGSKNAPKGKPAQPNGDVEPVPTSLRTDPAIKS